jgi:hypothetical protein
MENGDVIHFTVGQSQRPLHPLLWMKFSHLVQWAERRVGIVMGTKHSQIKNIRYYLAAIILGGS